MSLLEWSATIISLIYLYFAIKNRPVCFVFGIISSAIWAYVVFHSHLIFDTGLQIFYIGMSFLGLYRWKYGGTQKEELPITIDMLPKHLIYILLGSILSFALYQSSHYFEIINKPLADAFTTVFLIIGTILLVERKLYSWVYLVIADIGYVFIYADLDLWLFAGMMVVYSIAGVWGFLEWKRSLSGYQLSDR